MALVEYGSDLDDTGQTHGASNMDAAFTPCVCLYDASADCSVQAVITLSPAIQRTATLCIQTMTGKAPAALQHSHACYFRYF